VDPVIDVKYSSQKFVKQVTDSNGPLPNDLQKIVVGSIKGSYVSTTIRLASGGEVTAFDADLTKNKVLSGATITLTGPTIAAASKVYLNTMPDCGSTTKVGADATPVLSAGATSGASVGTVTLSFDKDKLAVFQSGLDVCLEVNGTTNIPDGQITATIQGARKNGLTVFELATGNLATVRRNGVVLRVLNIPNSTNADQAFIRFYNTSAQDVKVTGSLYGQDGKVIGTNGATLFDALKAHDVEILDAAKLAAKVGASAPWTGRAWLMVQAETAPELLKVQALVRSPTGILINLSTDAVD